MLTPATITVTFTANYTGLHRICWRVCGVGSYVCTNLVDCVGGGNVCSATVSIMVDPESCDPVCFEGYIQAACNPEGSSTDQVLWNATFIPSPACKAFSITCTDTLGACGVISAIEMGLNCDGTVRPAVGPIDPMGSIYVCNTGIIPILPAGYEMIEVDMCCYDCTEYSAVVDPANPGDSLDGSSLYYIDCATRQLVRQDFTGTSGVIVPPFCAVTGSPYLQLTTEAVGNVNTIGSC